MCACFVRQVQSCVVWMKFGADGVLRLNGSASLQYMSMDTTNLAIDCMMIYLTGHK